MDVQAPGILYNNSIQGNTTTVKNTESDFKELFEKITGGELAREIRGNYNVTLNVGNVADCDQFLETNDLRGTKQPPVKSAGMIVYPDGKTLYWIEGYPNEIGSEKDKKMTNEKSINELLQTYSNADNQITEKDLSTFMQIMATGYKRQNADLY